MSVFYAELVSGTNEGGHFSIERDFSMPTAVDKLLKLAIQTEGSGDQFMRMCLIAKHIFSLSSCISGFLGCFTSAIHAASGPGIESLRIDG